MPVHYLFYKRILKDSLGQVIAPGAAHVPVAALKIPPLAQVFQNKCYIKELATTFKFKSLYPTIPSIQHFRLCRCNISSHRRLSWLDSLRSLLGKWKAVDGYRNRPYLRSHNRRTCGWTAGHPNIGTCELGFLHRKCSTIRIAFREEQHISLPDIDSRLRPSLCLWGYPEIIQ